MRVGEKGFPLYSVCTRVHAYCIRAGILFHTFSDCAFVKKFSHEVINWFNVTNKTLFNPSIQEKLFGVTAERFGINATKKFNYTLLFMKYYIILINCILAQSYLLIL